jgi:hypothetical protein
VSLWTRTELHWRWDSNWLAPVNQPQAGVEKLTLVA